MSSLRRVRAVAAATLTGTAWVLEATGRAVGGAASVLRPSPSPAEQVAASYRDRGRVQSRPQEAVGDVVVARVPPTHVEELAARPASEVVARVPDLSTDELRRLLESEQAGRRRKTVLDAIERSAADHTG